jgi:hypothetical protein
MTAAEILTVLLGEFIEFNLIPIFLFFNFEVLNMLFSGRFSIGLVDLMFKPFYYHVEWSLQVLTGSLIRIFNGISLF